MQEFRSIPIIGVDNIYEVNRRGEFTKAGVPLRVGSKWEARVWDGAAQVVYPLHYLIDRAFPECTDDRYRVFKRNNAFTFFECTGEYGSKGAWRTIGWGDSAWRDVHISKLTEKQRDIAVNCGWPEAAVTERVIDGDEYLRRKLSDAEAKAAPSQIRAMSDEQADAAMSRSAAMQAKHEEDFKAAAWDKSYPLSTASEVEQQNALLRAMSLTLNSMPHPLSAVSEDEQLDVESPFESLKRDAQITDPLITLAEALASTAEAIRLLVKNRSGQ